jgi:hypothetical protein
MWPAGRSCGCARSRRPSRGRFNGAHYAGGALGQGGAAPAGRFRRVRPAGVLTKPLDRLRVARHGPFQRFPKILHPDVSGPAGEQPGAKVRQGPVGDVREGGCREAGQFQPGLGSVGAQSCAQVAPGCTAVRQHLRGVCSGLECLVEVPEGRTAAAARPGAPALTTGSAPARQVSVLFRSRGAGSPVGYSRNPRR